MKTLNELIKEITASKELQTEMKALKSRDEFEAFFKAHDCSANVEEFAKALKELPKEDGAISDDDAEAVSGGSFWDSVGDIVGDIIDFISF